MKRWIVAGVLFAGSVTAWAVGYWGFGIFALIGVIVWPLHVRLIFEPKWDIDAELNGLLGRG